MTTFVVYLAALCVGFLVGLAIIAFIAERWEAALRRKGRL